MIISVEVSKDRTDMWRVLFILVFNLRTSEIINAGYCNIRLLFLLVTVKVESKSMLINFVISFLFTGEWCDFS